MARFKQDYTGDDRQDRASGRLAKRIDQLANARLGVTTVDLVVGLNSIPHGRSFTPRGRQIVSQTANSVLYGDSFNSYSWLVTATAPTTITVNWIE